ncbi:unnamed protein product [Closterium sp. NIES-53]
MPGSGGKHRVSQAAEAALGGVWTTTRLTRTVASAQDVGARTRTPTPLTCSVPLTELLRGEGLLTTLLLLALTTTGATPPRRATTSAASSAAAATTSAATATPTVAAATTASASTPTTTAAAAPASTAAADTSTPATTPATTLTSSAASTAASTAPAASTTAPAPFALARATSPAGGRRRTDRLKTNEVGRSRRGDRGQEGGGGTPLKDGGARVTTRGPYSENALLGC